MPVYAEGLDAAEQAADEAKKSSFHRVGFIKFEEGKTVCIRFVVPQTYTFGIHGGTPTKPKPEEFKGDKWPGQMFGICQNDTPFRLRDADNTPTEEFEPGYGQCYIHSFMRGKKDPKYQQDMSVARVQTFGLAVLREPQRDPKSGAVTGFKDVTEEFKAEDGTVYRIPKIGIVQQAYSNFWAPLKSSMFMGPSSLCGWDFGVTRQADNKYAFSTNATPEFVPGTEAWKRYDEAVALLGFDLAEQLVAWSSPDWYARWFIPGQTPKEGYGRRGDSEEESAGETAAPAGDTPKQEQVDAFAARMRAARDKDAAGAEIPF